MERSPAGRTLSTSSAALMLGGDAVAWAAAGASSTSEPSSRSTLSNALTGAAGGAMTKMLSVSKPAALSFSAASLAWSPLSKIRTTGFIVVNLQKQCQEPGSFRHRHKAGVNQRSTPVGPRLARYRPGASAAAGPEAREV